MKKKQAGLTRRFLNDGTGTTAVEFALLAAAFFTILFGIIEIGRLFLAWNAFQAGVENATRAALVDESLTVVELEQMIVDGMATFTVSAEDIDLDVTFPVVSGIDFVEVNGTYTFTTLVPFFPDAYDSLGLPAKSRIPRP